MTAERVVPGVNLVLGLIAGALIVVVLGGIHAVVLVACLSPAYVLWHAGYPTWAVVAGAVGGAVNLVMVNRVFRFVRDDLVPFLRDPVVTVGEPAVTPVGQDDL